MCKTVPQQGGLFQISKFSTFVCASILQAVFVFTASGSYSEESLLQVVFSLISVAQCPGGGGGGGFLEIRSV